MSADSPTDYLNLRTYDFYDYFILIFGMAIFGLICLITGCVWNKHLMRNKFIEISEIDEGEKRQNQFQRPKSNKYPVKSYSHKSSQEREQLSPKVTGFASNAYNVQRVNEDDGTIEIAVSLDRYN